MIKSYKKSLLFSIIFLIAFAFFSIIIKTIGLAEIGPQKSVVGLSELNKAIFEFFKTNHCWDIVSDIILYLALLISFVCAMVGVVQFIKRKNLMKVDANILSFLIVLIGIIISYIVFDNIVINYRPILVDNILELSYPSTHVLFSFSILIICCSMLNNYLKNKSLKIVSTLSATLISVVAVISRLLSGMHWFSDIVGALLLSGGFIFIYCFIMILLKNYQEKKRA